MNDSGKPQRKLMIPTGVTGDEVSDMPGDGNAFDIAASFNFEGDIFCGLLRPILKRIERGNADRVVELSPASDRPIASVTHDTLAGREER